MYKKEKQMMRQLGQNKKEKREAQRTKGKKDKKVLNIFFPIICQVYQKRRPKLIPFVLRSNMPKNLETMVLILDGNSEHVAHIGQKQDISEKSES